MGQEGLKRKNREAVIKGTKKTEEGQNKQRKNGQRIFQFNKSDYDSLHFISFLT